MAGPARRRAGDAAREAFGRVAPAEPAATPPPSSNGTVPAPEPAVVAPAPTPPASEMTPEIRLRWRQLLRSAALKVVADRQRADASTLAWDNLIADAAREGVPAGMVVAAAMDADPDGNILGDIPA